MTGNWTRVAVCLALGVGATLSAAAQNATSGGDGAAQPDVQARRGPGGNGGRRGGATRGTVTAVSGLNVTVKTEAGAAVTVVTTDNTRVRRDGQPSTVAAVQVGDEVVAMGMPDEANHAVHAMMVMDVSAAAVAKAKADMGKTYILGRVTAINDEHITVLRSDKVSQTITLDETTSIHRGGRLNAQEAGALQAMGVDAMGMGGGGMGGLAGGPGGGAAAGGGERRRGANAGANGGGAPPSDDGEAITLADVKVGDNIGGTGSVKGGVFVPTDLRVANGPAGGGRRGPGGGGNGDAPPPQR